MSALATPLHFTSGLHPQERGESLWMIFAGDKLLISPDHACPGSHLDLSFKRTLYVGRLGESNLFAGEVDPEQEAPAGWLWSPLRGLFGIISDEHFAVAGRAMQLLDWDRTHAYCGCCGNATFIRSHERCRECPACGHLAYTKVSPAIAVLIKKGAEILLARSPTFPEKFYSVLAGYVDPGETLEECVAREAFEEVGVKVNNIRYFGSQPWPFSRSLMIAFTCDWAGGDIAIDPQEISHAAWFDPTRLPQLPPPLSISRALIDTHLRSL